MSTLARRAIPVAFVLLSTLGCASALIALAGQAPLQIYRLLLDGTWGNPYGIGQVLFKATPLVFTGLAVSLPYHAGLFNVGAEGQAALGGFVAGLVGASLPAGAPAIAAVPLCTLSAFLAGALAGAIPAAFKVLRGAHEVVVTIMLNFVILAVLSSIGKSLFVRETMHSAPIAPSAELPLASAIIPSLSGSALNAAFPVALAVAVAGWWYLEHTAAGFRVRAVVLSPDAAAAAGVSVRAQQALALCLGGGCAGLVGVNFVLGYKHYYEEGFSGGVGFMGIAVALLGRNHAAGIVAAALLFGSLSQGGLAINAHVPKDMVDVLQAVIILAAGAAAVSFSPARRSRPRPTAEGEAGTGAGGDA